MSVARSIAVTGSVQPVSGSKLIVERMPPSPTGLNTNTGPRVFCRIGAHSSSRSVRVEVTTAAPGASRTRPASQPVLPVRGPPKTRVTSSIEDHTRCTPTRHSSTPTAEVGTPSRSRRVSDPSEGRTVHARRRVATVPACRATSRVEATPARRRERADQRVTVARRAGPAVPAHQQHDRAGDDAAPARTGPAAASSPAGSRTPRSTSA